MTDTRPETTLEPLAELAIEAAAAAARDEVEPTTDIHAHADYRREAVATLVRRALGALPA